MLEQIPFHQYQRYGMLRKIMEQFRVNGESHKILEVGANAHQNGEKFLPKDEFLYLDITLPPELIGNPKYILGDATELDFPEGSFDYVVALDVLEHVPAERRRQFLREVLRVSKKGLFCQFL